MRSATDKVEINIDKALRHTSLVQPNLKSLQFDDQTPKVSCVRICDTGGK
jgi:hypothetical protein